MALYSWWLLLCASGTVALERCSVTNNYPGFKMITAPNIAQYRIEALEPVEGQQEEVVWERLSKTKFIIAALDKEDVEFIGLEFGQLPKDYEFTIVPLSGNMDGNNIEMQIVISSNQTAKAQASSSLPVSASSILLSISRPVDFTIQAIHMGSQRKASKCVQDHREAICSSSNWLQTLHARCWDTSSKVYNTSRAVTRLFIKDQFVCTGFLISSLNILLTNHHCVSSQEEADAMTTEFIAEAEGCKMDNGMLKYKGELTVKGGQWLGSNKTLDYSVIKLNSQVARRYGFMELNFSLPVEGTLIYVPQHPKGFAKVIGWYQEKPDGTLVDTRLTKYQAPCTGDTNSELGYMTDTDVGSSGAPVLDRLTHKVIGLHHCGGCPNRAVAMQHMRFVLEPTVSSECFSDADCNNGRRCTWKQLGDQGKCIYATCSTIGCGWNAKRSQPGSFGCSGLKCQWSECCVFMNTCDANSVTCDEGYKPGNQGLPCIDSNPEDLQAPRKCDKADCCVRQAICKEVSCGSQQTQRRHDKYACSDPERCSLEECCVDWPTCSDGVCRKYGMRVKPSRDGQRCDESAIAVPLPSVDATYIPPDCSADQCCGIGVCGDLTCPQGWTAMRAASYRCQWNNCQVEECCKKVQLDRFDRPLFQGAYQIIDAGTCDTWRCERLGSFQECEYAGGQLGIPDKTVDEAVQPTSPGGCYFRPEWQTMWYNEKSTAPSTAERRNICYCLFKVGRPWREVPSYAGDVVILDYMPIPDLATSNTYSSFPSNIYSFMSSSSNPYGGSSSNAYGGSSSSYGSSSNVYRDAREVVTNSYGGSSSYGSNLGSSYATPNTYSNTYSNSYNPASSSAYVPTSSSSNTYVGANSNPYGSSSYISYRDRLFVSSG